MQVTFTASHTPSKMLQLVKWMCRAGHTNDSHKRCRHFTNNLMNPIGTQLSHRDLIDLLEILR